MLVVVVAAVLATACAAETDTNAQATVSGVEADTTTQPGDIDDEPTGKTSQEPPAVTKRDDFVATEFCAGLSASIDHVERTWDADEAWDLGAPVLNQAATDLQSLADSLPDDAPSGVAELLEISAGLQAAYADAADASDPLASIRQAIGPLFLRMEAVEVDPAEAWVAEQCGIERVGILLRLTDDDRTSTAPATTTDGDAVTATDDEGALQPGADRADAVSADWRLSPPTR